MLALDVEEAKRLALIAVAGLVVLVVLVATVVKNIMAKVLSIVVLMGLSLVAWSQRQNVQDCAERVRDAVVAAATGAIPDVGVTPSTVATTAPAAAAGSGGASATVAPSACRLFRQDVDVPIDA